MTSNPIFSNNYTESFSQWIEGLPEAITSTNESTLDGSDFAFKESDTS